MREELMITRSGKQYVLFAGLLDEAHTRGLVSIDTELIQVPKESNDSVAIVKATVQMEQGSGSSEPREVKTFTGIGDASPSNVSRNIVPHLIRMAETRAKARALRDAVNVSATALEEISDTSDGESSESPGASTGTASRGRSRGLGGSTAQAGSGNVRDLPRQDGGTQGSTQQNSSQPESPRNDSGEKATKSQVDFIRTLAEEWRGEKGVERLESRIGKPLEELSHGEATEWIEKLTPEDQGQAAE